MCFNYILLFRNIKWKPRLVVEKFLECWFFRNICYNICCNLFFPIIKSLFSNNIYIVFWTHASNKWHNNDDIWDYRINIVLYFYEKNIFNVQNGIIILYI